jgi:ribulose-5-phosphate 4-epimerase/fuculose-1-phosphate aldolase
MDDHTYTHLSARSGDGNHFYIHPFGLRFEEVEADNLMKVTFDGTVVEGEEYHYNRTGYVLHSIIYKARPDIKSIFHLHTPYITATSALEDGLLPITQWALHFYDRVVYHEYNSLLLDFDDSERLIADLGAQYVMIMRNHGAVLCGKTIHEAFFYAYHLEMSCKTQYIALSTGKQLVIPSKKVCEKSVGDLLTFESDLGARDWAAWSRLISKVV